MDFLIVALLAGIFGLFFYRWVPPHHKRVVGKVVIGTVAVVALIIVGIVASDDIEAERNEKLRNNILISHIPGPPPPSVLADRPKMAESALWAEYIADGPRSEVTFEICNRNSESLTSVTFYPKAFNRGRSTAHDLTQPENSGGYADNRFESDRIIQPAKCDTLTWSGKFLVRDSVAAEATYTTLLR